MYHTRLNRNSHETENTETNNKRIHAYTHTLTMRDKIKTTNKASILYKRAKSIRVGFKEMDESEA